MLTLAEKGESMALQHSEESLITPQLVAVSFRLKMCCDFSFSPSLVGAVPAQLDVMFNLSQYSPIGCNLTFPINSMTSTSLSFHESELAPGVAVQLSVWNEPAALL